MKRILTDWMNRAIRSGLLARESFTARLRGLELNQLYDRQTARILARVLERRSNCVDVGCHEGMFLDEMRRRAPGGTHYAFEPLPQLHAVLAAKYAGQRNVKLHEVALSNGSGETTFQHVVSNPAYSGVRRRLYDRAHEEVVEITVQRARLDDILPGDTPIRLLKIDVEGGELQVLEGATATLRRWHPFIIFEHGKRAAGCYGTRPEQVHDLLAACGLRVGLLGEWLKSKGARSLTREAFIEQFDQEKNYYFLAYP